MTDEFGALLAMVMTVGAGGIASLIITHWKWGNALEPDTKRLFVAALTGGIAALAYIVAVAMEYRPTPPTWRDWVKQTAIVVIVALASFGSATLVNTSALKKYRSDSPAAIETREQAAMDKAAQ